MTGRKSPCALGAPKAPRYTEEEDGQQSRAEEAAAGGARGTERAGAAKEQRRRRLILLGASTVAALAVVGVLIAVSQSGGGDGGGLGKGEGLTGTAEVSALYRNIPQSGATLGSPKAPVTMVEFADLQCPFCAQYTRDTLPTLVKRYVRAGKLKIEFRPITILGPDSGTAHAAAASAAQRNRLWQFADLFYLNQGPERSGYVTDDFLTRIARGAGLDPKPIVTASQTPKESRSCARPPPRRSATASRPPRASSWGGRAALPSSSSSRASSRVSSPRRSTKH